MKLIDARERFERRREAAAGFSGRVALEGLAFPSKGQLKPLDACTLRRYRDSVRESEQLMAEIDELNSWASKLKVHSEVLERETRALLRRLERSLESGSHALRDISR